MQGQFRGLREGVQGGAPQCAWIVLSALTESIRLRIVCVNSAAGSCSGAVRDRSFAGAILGCLLLHLPGPPARAGNVQR